MKPRVLITDDVHPLLPEKLGEWGYDVALLPGISLEKVQQVVGDYEGLVINTRIKADKKMLDAATQLRFIARLGSGMEIIDVDYAKQKGIRCVNSPEGNRDAVAEHAIGMLLALMNNMLRADAQVRDQQWLREENRGEEIGGKTIGILGYGNTGEAFAKKLSGFGVKVLVYDKYRKSFGSENVKEAALEEIWEQADVLSLHLPLTEETEGWVNAAFLEHFRKSIYLINTSRGKIVVLRDLLEKMGEGKIKGAGLDVLANEKFPYKDDNEIQLFEQLRKRHNVIITPHIAGWTIESKRRIAEVLLEKLEKLTR